MSMHFIVELAGREHSLINALTSADLALTRLGGRRGGTISRDDIEGLAGRAVEDDEVSAQDGISAVRHRLADWRDATIEYNFPQFTAYLQLIVWKAGGLNAFLYLNRREVVRMRNNGTLITYYHFLAALGTAIRATGGLGEVELPIEVISPESIPDAIFARSAPLGLVSIAEISHDELYRKIGSAPYKIESVSGFYVLTRADGSRNI